MDKLDRLIAEVEALKIICMVTCQSVDRFQWREIRDMSLATAKKHAEMLQATPMTDGQLELLLVAVDALTGKNMPTWQSPLLPESVPPTKRPPAKKRAAVKKAGRVPAEKR